MLSAHAVTVNDAGPFCAMIHETQFRPPLLADEALESLAEQAP